MIASPPVWSIYDSRLELMLQNEMFAGSLTWNVHLRTCYLWDTAVLLHHISLWPAVSFPRLWAFCLYQPHGRIDNVWTLCLSHQKGRKVSCIFILYPAIHFSIIRIQFCCLPTDEATRLLCRWVIYNDHKVCLSERPPKDLGYIYFYHRLSSS